MPSRGYRKGVSDAKIPSPKRIHTRLPDAIHAALMADADSRSRTACFVMAAILTAHYTQARLELPHPRGPTTDLVNQLARLGNNLNQIATEAHRYRLPHLDRDARALIARINAVVARLAS